MATGAHICAIENVNIFNGESFNLGTIWITDGKINTQPPDRIATSTIDGTRKYLVPGFIDCHVHLWGNRSELDELASYGVTTALDMASLTSSWQALKQHTDGTCDFLTAGIPATCPGSPHANLFGPLLADHLISKPEEAPEWVAKRVSEGSDYIKLVADSPIGPEQDTLNALVTAAHANHKQVVCHAANRRAFEMAIDAASDFVTHAPMDMPLTPGSIDRMKTSGLVAIPTLTIEESRSKVDGLNYPAARESVKMLYEAGLTVLAGTDSTGTLGPHPLPYGSTLHHEFELLVGAGMTPLDVLRGTTELGAKCFGLDDRGVIADGNRADLVLLKANPLVDIKNTREIESVWCSGVEVRRDVAV